MTLYCEIATRAKYFRPLKNTNSHKVTMGDGQIKKYDDNQVFRNLDDFYKHMISRIDAEVEWSINDNEKRLLRLKEAKEKAISNQNTKSFRENGSVFQDLPKKEEKK
jgi:hypothetical protein